MLENLLEETNRLTTVADQLLFLSRQDAGLHPTVREDVALDELLREVVADMRLVAQEKGVMVTLDGCSPCQLVSDSRLLRRVFYNLLDNAIKYTERSGRVTVTSKLKDGAVSIAVADTGAGIPPEHLPRIFERFYRADPARTDDGNGAGLGMAICQSIVKALGGKIGVESAVGQGTKVHVVLSPTR